MLKNSHVVPVMSPMPPVKCYSFIRTCTVIEKYFGENDLNWPLALSQLKREEKDLAFNAFGMAVAFLTDALIDEQTLVPGHFEVYEPASKQGTGALQYMVLDAQALQHLEVVESSSGAIKGSLLNYVDYCKT